MSTDNVIINKNKLIASTISIILFSLLLLFLFLYSFLSPTHTTNNSSSIEIGFSASEKINEPGTTSNSVKNSIKPNNQKNQLNSNSSIIAASNDKTPTELLRDKFFENKGKSSTGNEKQSGEKAGNPNGNNTKNSTDLISPESTTNKLIAVSLEGRKIESQPTLSKDTKEEGKVVVEITVDSLGKVIKADPNGRGTTTSSSVLKGKAKQTALSTKFNTSSIEEQKGTITIIFSF